MNKPKRNKGFTLIEMMLVLVIISIIIYASISFVQQKTLATRIDRAAVQMQQIMNAGLSYYTANGTWPKNLSVLRDGFYLPTTATVLKNPWGDDYFVAPDTAKVTPAPPFANPPPMLFVWTTIPGSNESAAVATSILGNLPIGYTTANKPPKGNVPPAPGATCATDDNCSVVAMVNIPGQNLNNASAVNFAGLYHHGACIPVPQCPIDKTGAFMTPEVIVVPVSVKGINTQNNNTDVFPVSSFTAYAVGPTAGNPPACTRGTAVACNANPASTEYWRACLQVITEVGDVQVTRSDASWGQNVTLAAFTRCAINNEPSGSNFNVFSH